MFREAANDGDAINLEEYTNCVASYISESIVDVTATKTTTTCPNQKLWMTSKVCALLKTRDHTFKTSEKEALKTARANASHAIMEAKRAHAQCHHTHFQGSDDTRRL